jgi:hypothetical protein
MQRMQSLEGVLVRSFTANHLASTEREEELSAAEAFFCTRGKL